MHFTTVSPVLNGAACGVVWMSSMSNTAKIAITVLLLVKSVLFYYSAWMSESEIFQKVGVALCIIANVALVIYGLINAAYFFVVTVFIMLLVLLGWAFSTVFDFTFKKQKEK